MSEKQIHLVNPMCHLGGSELRTMALYRLLAPHRNVRIWATRAPLPEFDAIAPITRINPLRLSFPRGGTLVFVGAYFHSGNRFARPQRTILLYNIPQQMHLQRSLQALSLGGRRAVDIVFTSEEMRRIVGLPGVVEDSPIDLAHSRPRADTWSASAARPLVVGRVSRDVELKFAENDQHGINGFIADDDHDVLHIVDGLRSTPGEAQAIGRAARATMEERYGRQHVDKIVAFYTRSVEGAALSLRRAPDVAGANG